MAAGGRQPRPGAAVTALRAAWLLLLALGPAAAAAAAERGGPGQPRSAVRVLSAANWSLVLQGQWMVQFYAPWCPACQQTEAAWENFAKESEHLDTTVGKVDVTQEPGLSGRFFVTTLPTIYHAKDGVFRRYRGSRTLEDLRGYILERKWEVVEPIPGWKSPSSIMMHGMAGLFHFSGWIRGCFFFLGFTSSLIVQQYVPAIYFIYLSYILLFIQQIHSYFTGTLGIPVWGSYAIFILATLLIGLILALILVLIADCLCPPKPRYRAETSVELIEKDNAELTAVQEVEEAEEFSANELEEALEERKDISDGEDGAKSSEEANSNEDGSEEDSALDEGSGTEETEDICEQHPTDLETQSSVRQRKNQVADNGL